MPNYPQVNKQIAADFFKKWDRGGIKIIVDDTMLQGATDFTNVALRSYYQDIEADLAIAAKVKAAMAAKQAPVSPEQPVSPVAEKPKSSIILTD